MATSSSHFSNRKRPLDESSSDESDNKNKQLEKIFEPMLRKVVSEEVERVVTRRFRPCMTRSPSIRIQAPEPLPLQLVFPKPLKGPIYTLNSLVSGDGSPLQVRLLDPRSNPTSPFPSGGHIKIQIVVLRGEFPAGDRTNWSAEEFNDSILEARNGKRPLIAGKLTELIKPAAEAAEFTNLMITDNSSWTWSRKFRLGARLAVEGHSGHCEGLRILEAVSEAFVVRDQRGESYMKHYPPTLEDEVWRLKRIRKGGPFHDSLSSNGILTVQDLLKMSVVYPDRLSTMLGPKMTAKKWAALKNHAETCDMGNKLYVYVIPSDVCSPCETALVLDPVCHVVAAQINRNTLSIQQFSTLIGEDFMGNLVREAYSNWNTLQEVDRFLIESAISG